MMRVAVCSHALQWLLRMETLTLSIVRKVNQTSLGLLPLFPFNPIQFPHFAFVTP